MENFNELFKKKLAEQQFDGKEKYWLQLEKKLNENAQEKVVIAWYKKWLLPAVAIVIAGAASLIYIYNSKSNIINKNTTQNIPSNVQLLTAQKVEVAPKINTPNNSNPLNTTEADDTEYALNNSLVKDKKIGSSIASSQLTKTTLSLTNSSSNAKDAPSNSSSNNILNNNSAPIAANTTKKEPILSTVDFDETTINLAAPSFNAFANANTSKTEINNAAKVSDDDYFTANSGIKALDFSQVEMPLAFLSPKALSALIYPVSPLNVKDDLTPINSKKPKTSLHLSVYGGAIYSIKNIMTVDGNSADYLMRRKAEENNSIKPNAGFDVELKRGHWTFTSGINFHQQGEKRNYSDQFKRIVPYDSLVININNTSKWLVDSTMFYALQYNSTITSTDTTVTYYDETTGQFYTAQLPVNITHSTVVDTNFYYLIDSTYHQSIDTAKTNYALKKQVVVKDPNQANLVGRNTFTYVEVPVLIGYEWGLKRWRLSVKGGLALGILTQQQSFYLTNDEAQIAPVSTDVYSKVIYNGIFRVGMHYSFTPQFGIDFVPFSRLNINNMTNNNATFKQKYYNVGLQVGFNYKL
jgi:hypothetical protein